ncbi:hypothetical protein [Stenotrophomonas phage CM2]
MTDTMRIRCGYHFQRQLWQQHFAGIPLDARERRQSDPHGLECARSRSWGSLPVGRNYGYNSSSFQTGQGSASGSTRCNR